MGFFQLLYTDAADNALSAADQQTICGVFKYLTTVFTMPPGIDIRVRIDAHDFGNTTQLAVGTPVYRANATCGPRVPYPVFLSHGGEPDTELNIDMEIEINTAIQNFYNGPLPPAQGDFDLYTIVLHEAMHGLGFASRISDTGQSAGSFYSSYDVLLQTQDGIPLLENVSEPMQSGFDPVCCGKHQATFLSAAIANGELPDNFADGVEACIEGTLIVNQDYSLNDVTFLMRPGSRILVETGKSLTTNESMFMGCDQMWRGMEVRQGGQLSMKSKNIVADAQYAIYIQPTAGQPVTKVDIQGNDFVGNFVGNFVGIYSADMGANSKVNGTLIDNNFKVYPANEALKPPYSGQTSAPEGLPEQNNFPLAGVYVNPLFTTFSSSNNTFQKLVSGIVLLKVSAAVNKNGFFSLSAHADDYPAYPYAGHALDLQGGGPEYLLAKDNTVTNCSHGIITYRASLDAYGNHMQTVGNGIRAFRLNGGLIRIGGDNTSQLNSLVGITRTGISVSAFDYNASVEIVNNRVSTIAETSDNSAFGGILLNANLADATVRDNTVNVFKAKSGILLRWGVNVAALNNNINLLSSSEATAGIHLQGTLNCTVQDNLVIGNGIGGTDNHGLWIDYARNNAYCTNSLDKTRYGTYVTGISDAPNNFQCNDFGAHTTGLWLDGANSFGRIGSQFHRKNCWSSDSGGATWDGVSSQSASLYPFDVDINVAACFLPSPVFPAQGWFDPSIPDPSEISCAEVSCDPGEFDLESEDAIKIASGTINAGPYTDAVRWVLGQYLYENGYGLPTNNGTVQAFFGTQAQTTIGQFHTLDQGLRGMYDGNPVEMARMGNQLDDLADKMTDLAATDDSLMTASGPELLQLELFRGNLTSEIRLLADSIHVDYQAVNSDRINDVNGLKTQNAAITTQHIFEQNERDMNRVLLSYLAREGTHLTADEQQSLQSIAVQCPLAGGSAVLEARALLALEAGSYPNYDDGSACQSGGTYGNPVPSPAPKVAAGLRLYPNPAKREATLGWDTPAEQAGELNLYDARGQHLLRINIPEGANQRSISLKGVPAGLYFIRANIGETDQVLRLVVQP